MIPRTLVPLGSRPPAKDAPPSQRRRPTTLDERTLVPAMLPIVVLDGKSNIPRSLPLGSIAARVVVPRDVNQEAYNVEENHSTPIQPTDMDERIAVPQGAAPPERTDGPLIPPGDLVDLDVFMTGEVNLLTKPQTEEKTKWDLITRVSSVVFHIALIAAVLLQAKLFPPHVPTQQEIDLANRQLTWIPPESSYAPKPKPQPRPAQPPAVHVDPRVINKVAPPVPQPAPRPEPPKRELPDAPAPKIQETPREVEAPTPKTDPPKAPLKLDTPDMPSGSPGGGPPGHGQGSFGNGYEILTDLQGVDFDDYMHRMLENVRRNWYAVMPESALLGERGRVLLRFKIMANGGVPNDDPSREMGSGKEPLDRAAISAIRSSNPFEPLPSAFPGPYIEIRIMFLYNLPIEDAYK
jgi:TonB family protein